MSAQERSNIISRVEETQWGKRKILTQLQVPKEYLLPVAGPCTAREARQLHIQYPDSLE